MATKANSKVKAATVVAPTTPFSGLLAAPSVPVKAQVAKQPKNATLRVVMGPKPYKVACEHNNAWWAIIGKALAQGPATVAQVVEQGVPSHFVGYAVRKGYLVAAAE
jgi:hypothetical protein